MPSKIVTPRFALSAEFDAREWSGVELYQKQALGVPGSIVSMPTFGDGEGLYRDVIAFLNGYGCPTLRGLNSDLKQQWQARGGDPADISIYVNEDDRLEIRILDPLETIAVAADAENQPWGFDVAGHAAQGGIGSIVAVSDFVRGVVLRDGVTRPPRLTLTHSLGGADILLPRYAAYEQSVIHALRPRGGILDIDDVFSTKTLESFDNSVGHDLRVGVGFDEVRHWYRAIRPYLYRGDRVTFFPEWGEFRRAIRDAQVNEDQPAYDDLVTSDRDGYRGRYQCKLDNDTAERSVAAYEGTTNNNRIRHQVDLSLTILGEE